jgi:hypothetical protein
MKTQKDVIEEIKRAIPPDLWEKYINFSFDEMARMPELSEYAGALMKAAKDENEACSEQSDE